MVDLEWHYKSVVKYIVCAGGPPTVAIGAVLVGVTSQPSRPTTLTLKNETSGSRIYHPAKFLLHCKLATASSVAGRFAEFRLALSIGCGRGVQFRSESTMNTQYTKLGHAMPVRASMAAAQSPRPRRAPRTARSPYSVAASAAPLTSPRQLRCKPSLRYQPDLLCQPN